MTEKFIGQPLKPIPGAVLTEAMAMGAPSLPEEFTYRKQTIRITAILQEWRESGPCRNGGGERYLRKHWFHVRTNDDQKLKLYFERQPRGKKARWHLYSRLTEQTTTPQLPPP
jgi:hypothetical protein